MADDEATKSVEKMIDKMIDNIERRRRVLDEMRAHLGGGAKPKKRSKARRVVVDADDMPHVLLKKKRTPKEKVVATPAALGADERQVAVDANAVPRIFVKKRAKPKPAAATPAGDEPPLMDSYESYRAFHE
jgi:hypothetical protein